jgi:hypothetical protein
MPNNSMQLTALRAAADTVAIRPLLECRVLAGATAY